ncbi:hypothetical protein PMPD1_0670 [Paramixta manurensis]|uniref:Lipoprotein n=1 Tax=Paramixta manurensis TaxID=2740817 RepID=A0A6M8UFT7_9GAMM|nr:hypothetical protein PMPD1_0670 [Erwiniaceae bacterium PD-1]
MKWLYASISALMVSGCTAGLVLSGEHQADTQRILFYRSDFQQQNVQLGYYAMLAQKKELYDPRFENQHGTLTMTLTSPEDSRFMTKGLLTQRNDSQKGLAFNYQPIFNSMPTSGLILGNTLNYMANNAVSVTPLKNNGTDLLITHNGLILVND